MRNAKKNCQIKCLTVGVSVERDVRRERISRRLHARLQEGLVEEVERLLASGITAEQLIYYGLEYKYVTLFLTGALTRSEMEKSLEIAIHQFAKRQMTWFRGMERRGVDIKWIDGSLPVNSQVEQIKELML